MPAGTLPASGRAFDRPYMAVFELEGERIKRQTLHFDSAMVMTDLGPADATANNVEIARGVYEAFNRQDLQYILDHLDDNVSWGIESVAREVPPYGILTGKQNVPTFFAAWGQNCDYRAFAASDFVAAGDHVFCTLSYDLTVKATGKRLVNSGCSQQWTFKGGKIVRFRGWEDTAATRDAFQK
jgi:ketosteroid isomerase-like protein